MKCRDVEDRLLDYIEDELPETQRAAFRAHVGACDACQKAYQDTVRMLGVIDVARRYTLPNVLSSGRAEPPDESPEPQTWQTGQALGDFEIIGEIGRGGMGVVHRARQRSLDRIVALKVLPNILGQAPKAISRFQKEAQAAARLHHTNIVPVYAQGEHQGHYFYAMELIDGEGLDRVMRRAWDFVESGLGRGDAARILRDHRQLARMVAAVAEGLEHAHAQGIIHRDIKPQNLLYASDGALHITDFGLARLLDEPSVTVTGEMLGTPAYMSPEQVRARRDRIDHRTDIYSLGVTLYELLTGRRPFTGATRDQIIARICTEEPRAPRRLRKDVPLDLETICLRAIEKDTRRRFATAGEFAAELRRFADNRPILSRRVSIPEKIVKWVRRHPARSAIIALSVALLLGTLGWTVQTVKARHEKADALVRRAYDRLAVEDYHHTREAFRLLEEARRLGPDEVRYRTALGLAHMMGDPDEAIRHLEWAVRQGPDNTEIMYLLAWALRRNQQLQDAEAWVERAKQAGGAGNRPHAHFFHAQAVVRNNPDEALQAYDEAIRLLPDYAMALVHRARADNHWMYHHRNLERFRDIESDLRAASRLQPNNAYPRYLLSLAYRISAEIYEALGAHGTAEERFELALQWAKDAQAREPDSPHAYVCEAEYWESRGDYKKAIDARIRAEPYCRTPSQRIELRTYRWRLYYWQGMHDAALADLAVLSRIAPRADPSLAWYRWLLPALIHREQQQPDEAWARLESAMAMTEQDFRTVTGIACALRMLGRPEAAANFIERHADRLRLHDAHLQYDAPGWAEALFALCRGERTFADLDTEGVSRRDQLAWAPAWFFAGARALGRGDRAAAREAFQACEKTFDYDDYCYLAKVIARKMERAPGWPAWIPAAEADAQTPPGTRESAASAHDMGL